MKCDCKKAYKKDLCKRCKHIHYAANDEWHYHKQISHACREGDHEFCRPEQSAKLCECRCHIIDFTKESTLTVCTSKMGFNLFCDSVRLDFDGDCVLFVSHYDGKTLGWLKISKNDKTRLKSYVRGF